MKIRERQILLVICAAKFKKKKNRFTNKEFMTQINFEQGIRISRGDNLWSSLNTSNIVDLNKKF